MRDPRIVTAIAAAFLACLLARGTDATLTAYPHWLFGIVVSVFAGAVCVAGPRIERSASLLTAVCAGAAAALVIPAGVVDAPGEVVSANVGHHSGDLFAALERLDDDPTAMVGRRLNVSGEWHGARSDRSATVSRRIMTCCAADAIAVGFDVESDRPFAGRDGSRVFVSGILQSRMSAGEVRYVITGARVSARP